MWMCYIIKNTWSLSNICNNIYVYNILFICLGLLLGGGCGLINGIMKGGKTKKLFLNSVLNSTSVIGPSVANQMASLTMIFYALNNMVKLITKNDEIYNSSIAGFLAGCIYKSSSNYKILGSYSIMSSAVFSCIDYGFKKGYIWFII